MEQFTDEQTIDAFEWGVRDKESEKPKEKREIVERAIGRHYAIYDAYLNGYESRKQYPTPNNF